MNDANSLIEVTQIVKQCVQNDENSVDGNYDLVVKNCLLSFDEEKPNKTSIAFVLNFFFFSPLRGKKSSFTWIYLTLCSNSSIHCWLCSLLPAEFYCFKTMAAIDRGFASFCCAVLLILNIQMRCICHRRYVYPALKYRHVSISMKPKQKSYPFHHCYGIRNV